MLKDTVHKGRLVAYIANSQYRFAKILEIENKRGRGVRVLLDHGCDSDKKYVSLKTLQRMKRVEFISFREFLYRANAIANSLSVAPSPTEGP